jgi:uncharacterized glyoxalase superfamily protein PhnB
MKNPPANFPRISSAAFYEDPRKAIDFLCKAFGFEVQIKVEGEDGAIHHSELVFGGGLVMVGGTRSMGHPEDNYRRSPRQAGGNTQTLFVYVDDVDAHCSRARTAGARIVHEPTDVDYGPDHWSDRNYECEDLEGHHWWFAQRIRG